MPHDWPNLPDMLLTVREFLDDLTPRLDGQDRYHALCAIYLLDITQRELSDWSPDYTADDARLAALIDGAENMSPGEIVGTLCQGIRKGNYDERLPQLLDVLRAHVTAKVRVTKPDYLDQRER